jgi:hypothetical protein
MTKIHIPVIAVFASLIGIMSLGMIHPNAFADHAFEGGVASGTMPNTNHVLLAGQVMRPGDYLPVADYSPNYVTGHFLLIVPCDSRGIPSVIPIGGHIDEHDHKTWVDQLEMNYIAHASTPGKTCVYHSHVPSVGLSTVPWAGPPRVTDMGLLNISSKTVVFRTGNAAMFTLLTVAGDISTPNGYGAVGTLPSPYNSMRLPGDVYSRNLIMPIDDPTGFLPTGPVKARP